MGRAGNHRPWGVAPGERFEDFGRTGHRSLATQRLLNFALADGIELVPVETPPGELFKVGLWRPGIKVRANAAGVESKWQIVPVLLERKPPCLIDCHFGVYDDPVEIEQNRCKIHERERCPDFATEQPGCAVDFFIRQDRSTRETPSVITTRAILTRVTKLTETSLIVHWFTADLGLLKTVARGARRPKSPFAGKMDLFFTGEISVVRSRRSGLDTLCEVVIEDWREGLRKSWPATLMAGYFCQLAEAVVEPGHPEPEIFNLLGRALGYLEGAPPTLRALRFYESEIARHLGISSHSRQAEPALREALGAMPKGRERVLESLSHGEGEISSSQNPQNSE